jgi:hypothetical protein
MGLKAIGDSLRTFIASNDSYKVRNARSMAHILVDLDAREGFFKEINIFMGEKSYVPTMSTFHFNYVNIPFQCACYHRVGHILVDRDRSFHKKFCGTKEAMSINLDLTHCDN